MLRRLVVVSAFLLIASVSGAQEAGLDFFEKKVRPVLAEHCYSCHSAKKQKAGLVLDSRDGARSGGDSGPAIVAGKPDDSLLIKAIRYTDPDLRMPPKGKLSEAVIADLEKWVAMGAPDPRRGTTTAEKKQSSDQTGAWVYQPPRSHPIPAVKNAAWPRGDIDRFLLNKMEQAGLRPAGAADRATLIRRAYYALIGLPPTPEQIDAFVKDAAPDALLKVIDELLASKHFGERWGRHWLDVARYAESSGGGRSLLFKDAWRYRDYVIDSFNEDRPFDRFIREQIAGDLIAADTPEERQRLIIATAFLLLGPTNYELQDKPVLEMDIIDEQLDTIGRGFLGMTIGCARCHDHKFDPIPTKDYYALAGILKSTNMIVHENVSRWTEHALPASPEQAKAIKAHEAAVAALKEQIKLAKGPAAKADVDLASGAVAAQDLPGIVVDDSQAKVVGHWKHSKYSGVFVGDGYLYDERALKEEKTVTFIPDFSRAGTYEVRLSYVPHMNRASNVPVRIFHADGDNTVHVNQRRTPPIDGRFVSLGKYRFEPGNQWFVMVATDGADGHVVADAVQFLPEEAIEIKTARPAARSQGAVDVQALEAELKALIAKAPDRPTAMAVSDDAKVADCHICIRGNVHNKGPIAPRGFLSTLLPDSLAKAPQLAIGPGQSGRLQLAAWLASPENPLTARIYANRIWHHLMGAGLVRTVDNFGATGEAPSHPELLDFLAQRLIANGWSTKKLIREIMLSHAYQQASVGDPETTQRAAKADPENRLLWRMNRHRLEAECIRDALLAVSGSLDRTMHGPMVTKTTLERDYRFEDSRRSVYTPIFRNKLLELFEVFDFANPNSCLGSRSASTVAPQALFFMNSPFVMDQARRAAQTLLALPNLDDGGRLERLYRLALGRLPNENERELALCFVNQSTSPERGWAGVCQAVFACVDFRYVN